jgi:uncharacterized membrane protein YkvA (DUF1232 family)
MSMLRKYWPWFIALLYFVNPYDLLPDFVTGPGWLDDLGVLALAWWWAARLKRMQQARSGPWAGKENRQEPPGADRRAEDPSQDQDEDPYGILGVGRDASKAEIRTAYKRLIAKYHPDKVQHLGKEFQELAHKKFVAIQRAYETLVR